MANQPPPPPWTDRRAAAELARGQAAVTIARPCGGWIGVDADRLEAALLTAADQKDMGGLRAAVLALEALADQATEPTECDRCGSSVTPVEAALIRVAPIGAGCRQGPRFCPFKPRV